MGWREKIAKLLVRDGSDRKQLSVALGVPYNTLSNWLNKGGEPGVTAAFAIARHFSVSADWLYDDSRPWPPIPPAGVVSLDLSQVDPTTAALLVELTRRQAEQSPAAQSAQAAPPSERKRPRK